MCQALRVRKGQKHEKNENDGCGGVGSFLVMNCMTVIAATDEALGCQEKCETEMISKVREDSVQNVRNCCKYCGSKNIMSTGGVPVYIEDRIEDCTHGHAYCKDSVGYYEANIHFFCNSCGGDWYEEERNYNIRICDCEFR